MLVLDQGQIVVDGPPSAVLASPRVAAAYLGEEEP
jgi:ABC-type branched-subunit amino acid transport system ATPase component